MDSTKKQVLKGNYLFILSLIAIIAGLALIFLQIRTANQLRTSIEDEKFALAQAEALLKQRLDYQANAPFYREKAAKYLVMMPEQPQEENILRSLRLIAEEYDLRVLEVRFDSRLANVEGGFVQMPLVIAVEGSYNRLIQLLDHLQWSERAYRVNQVNISLSGVTPGEIRAVLTASAFYRTGN